jgi:hypothetical protein
MLQLPLALTLVLGTPDVDVSLTPSAQVLPAGCIAEIELVLSAASPTTVAAVDAVLSWNPSELELLGATPSAAGWLATGFLNDPDGINDDTTDGDAIFTALANPGAPPSLPPDLVVATFEFRVLGSGSVALLPSLGTFGATEVVGAIPGQDLTGSLSAPASVTATFVPAAEVVRTGSPPNPPAFLPGVTSGPLIGGVWDPVIDHTSFQPSAVLDFVGISLTPTNIPLAPYGTLLCLPPAIAPFLTSSPGVPFTIPVPDNCAFAGLTLCTQGLSADALGNVELANALDITLGNV